MTVKEALEKLRSFEDTSFALGHAGGILNYDGSTIAPKQSAKVRALTQGELSRISYELTTAPETVEMIETLKTNENELDFVTARKASELYRDLDHMRRIPKDLFVEYQKLCVESDAVWHEAKANNDYASFKPYLQKMFDMSRQIALCIEPDKDPYDTQLNEFERGLTAETCEKFFATLKAGIVPLLQKVIASPNQVREPLLEGNFPVTVQREFSDYIMRVMGLDPERSIIGETEHPFTTDFSKYDVRITTHYHEDAVLSSMYSVIHEGGHALYELNIGDDITTSCLGGGVSMAMHESQSRFYENIIGRSREFCGVILPWLTEHFPAQLSGLTQDRLYRAVNASAPSLIRTEADELTYCLHIMVRFELERMMYAGTITADDLPHEWNRLYKEYLGIDVPDDKRGVLQDSHWSFGAIGYFPSYAIGSAYGAQYLEEMNKSFDVFAAVAAGDFSPISDWFRERIWKYGKLYDPSDLFKKVCGEFRPEVYVKYLEDKFSGIYGLT
ncbi:MAG: carboxypeptidase M32 [Clostridia bacterium]|nr:carboxypeptidase M32 [Clostridia bacterium]